jgi:hypothetical protein
MIRQISYRAGLVWVAFVGLFALAFVLRWRVLEGYHPVLQNADEVSRFLNTLLIRHDRPALSEAFGIYTFNPTYDYTGFPPLQLWLHAWLHRWVEMQVAFPVPADYVLAARYLSLAASMLTLVLMLWMGYVLGRPLGNGWALLCGWLTGFVWAITPVIILVTNLGLADPLLYPFIPLCDHCDGLHGSCGLAYICGCLSHQRYPCDLHQIRAGLCACVSGSCSPGHHRKARLAGCLTLDWRDGGYLRYMTAGWLIWGNQMFGLENRETQIFYRDGPCKRLLLALEFRQFYRHP